MRVIFDQQLLSWSPEQVGRYWVDRRVRGQGQPPHVVPSAMVMLALVEKLAGAIGYVPAALVSDRVARCWMWTAVVLAIRSIRSTHRSDSEVRTARVTYALRRVLVIYLGEVLAL